MTPSELQAMSEDELGALARRVFADRPDDPELAEMIVMEILDRLKLDQ